MRNVICALIATMLSFLASVGTAQDTGPVLLTVTHGDTVTTYDLAALQDLGAETFDTTTIWTEGMQSFTGVPLAALVETLGIEKGVIKASAINDYTIEIPVTDAVAGGPIIAYFNNGAEMSVRDKGPLWIVYPYDSNADYQTEVIYSRSIWQLDRLETAD